MNVLVLHWRDIKNPSAGGSENVLHKILKEMVKLGFNVIMISSKFIGCKDQEIIDGIKIVRLGSKYSVYILAALYYIFYLRRKVNLVLDSITGIPWFTPLYVKKSKIALIYHLGKKETFFIELPNMAKIFGYILAVVALIAESLIPILYKNVPFITFSEDTKNDLTHFGIPRKHIFVVQEGIDISHYKPCDFKDNFPHIIYVGRLVKNKGVDILIKSLKLVVRIFPNVKLSIVGRGYFENNLRKLVKNLELEDNVVFHGYISESKKVKLLQRAHILVMPSLREGWATPVIEANACGTPAIGTNVRGVKSAIIDGVTGFLVPYGDIKELADKIIILLSKREFRQKIARNAIYWAKNFDQEIMIQKFINIINHYHLLSTRE